MNTIEKLIPHKGVGFFCAQNSPCPNKAFTRFGGFFIYRPVMEIDPQTIINMLFALVGGLGGWVLNNIRLSIESLRSQDSDLADKVQRIEVLVAGEYVKRDELEKAVGKIFDVLARIETKIDRKADK